jgi:hypothetical protein
MGGARQCQCLMEKPDVALFTILIANLYLTIKGNK